MSDKGNLFLEACGATGPVELEWIVDESDEVVRRGFGRPAVLVGRHPEADLILSDPRVGRRHAYLQMVEGRLFAVDLGSRDGLRWSGVPRRSGWVDRQRPVRVGPATIRVVGGDRDESEGIAGVGPGPLSRRFEGRQAAPGVVLEIRGGSGEPSRWSMDRPLALAGSAPDCRVQLTEPGTSRYVCGLVRTPLGVWMVDLLSSRGVSVNGVFCRRARLEDGDVLRVGGQSIRLYYEPTVTRAGPVATAPAVLLGRSDLAPMDPSRDAWELVPEMILRKLQGQDGSGQDPALASASAPFDHALLMLVRLLGEIHRDHLEIVREELEQIRRLNREMVALRGRPNHLEPPHPHPGSIPSHVPEPVPAPRPGIFDPGEVPEPPEPGRADPELVQEFVGRRLAAWEKERQGRWRKVMDLLVKP
jgi:pSer/pThr/pTyr-binding forkhead associated (FHA) protein